MVSASAIVTIEHSPEEGSLPLMLRPLLFTPAAQWLVCALQEAGVERFLLLTDQDLADAAAPCFPEGTQVCFLNDPLVDRVIQDFAAGEDQVITINRPVWLSLTAAQLLTGEVSLPQSSESDSGVYRVSGRQLSQRGGRALLTRGTPLAQEDEEENTLAVPLQDAYDLLEAQELARMEQLSRLIDGGVRMLDTSSVYVDPTVEVGAGTVLLPNVILRGNTVIGPDCEIGPNTMIRDCTLGAGCVANASQLNEAVFGERVNIGPFAYVRPGTRVGDGCKVGDFVEVKNAVIGDGTKLPHLIYVGDSDVGKGCNFGCGSITCNYDGNHKYRTTVGDNVFIGCNTNLVAPVTVEDGAYTAAGSTITRQVPANALAVARARQEHREGWAERHRQKK
jgi:bifunctional UDP-N-acetylglucosamine pyrophosphorylase/glucosamine-1-phosphate N-acetyltransferase